MADLTRFLILGLLASGSARVAGAQFVVVGSVVDSLRGARGVPHAVVRTVDGTRFVRADVNGAFAFDWDGSGRLHLVHRGPWLDSIGVEELSVSVEATIAQRDTIRVALAGPSAETLQAAICGTALADTLSVAFGEVRRHDGSMANGIQIDGRWWSSREVAGQRSVGLLALFDSSRADGSFALCGVPRGIPLTIQATGANERSGRISILAQTRVVRLDVVIAHPDESISVRGRVVDASGDPVAGAWVSLREDSTLHTRTGSDGSFRLDAVPARTGELVIRNVAYQPAVALLMPGLDSTVVSDVYLSRLPSQLAELRVTADRASYERLGFDERLRAGLGAFLTDSALGLLPSVTISAVASIVQRVSVARGPVPGSQVLLVRRGAGWCSPRFFVDGTDFGHLDQPEDAPEQAALVSLAKRLEIYSAGQAPPRFQDFDGCGAVVIWTQ